MKSRIGVVLALALCLFGFGSAIPAQAPVAHQPATQAPPSSSSARHHKAHTSSTTTSRTTTTTLSNDNHYVNREGRVVHSPAHSSSGVPAGASAQCSDGSYSF